MPNVFLTESTGRRFSLHDLPLYEDFPYLVTRLVPALYHLIPLPETCDEASLRSMARYQALCNQLPRCLVLDTTRAIKASSGSGTRCLVEGPESATGQVCRAATRHARELVSAWRCQQRRTAGHGGRTQGVVWNDGTGDPPGALAVSRLWRMERPMPRYHPQWENHCDRVVPLREHESVCGVL